MPLGKFEDLIPPKAIQKKKEAEEALKFSSGDEAVLLQVKAEY